MRRVVVTGLGAITPVGKDINSFWDSLTAGKHGIAPITRFDTTDYKAKLAAEVKDFSPADYYTDKSEMRRTDLFAQYAMGAAVQAMADSGIEGKIDGTRLGVYVGSGIGGMSTFVSETLKLESRGPGRVSPFFIPMMISNMAAGTIAIRFGAKGPTLPVVTACATSSNTVGEAYRAVAHGLCRRHPRRRQRGDGLPAGHRRVYQLDGALRKQRPRPRLHPLRRGALRLRHGRGRRHAASGGIRTRAGA